MSIPSPTSAHRAVDASGAVREFVDDAGTAWTVLEVANPGFSERLAALFPHPERRGGWLLFESEAGEKRRLSPYPGEWRRLAREALPGLCVNATPAGPHERRRRTDAE